MWSKGRTLLISISIGVLILLSVFHVTMEERNALRNNHTTIQEVEVVELELKKEELIQMQSAHAQDEATIAELKIQLEDAKAVAKEQRDAYDQTSKEGEAQASNDNATIAELTNQLEDAKAIAKEQRDAYDQTSKEGEAQASNDNANTTALDASSSSSLFEPHEICSYFPTQPYTATRFWQKYIPRILDASKNPLIPELLTDEEDAKMHTLLEKTLTPSRMRRAVRHMPTFSHATVKNVVEILQKRIQDPKNNPPLRIAVFGGSVTIGTGCHGGKSRGNLNCAWPQRLELLLNQFANMEVVKVYNLGIGGTDSAVGSNIVKYWMYPPDLAKVGPDVIINSYSTNESLPPWNIDPDADAVTIVMDAARDRLQNFARIALQSKQCTVQPLVVHVDDYLGPLQVGLLGELSYNTAMTQIAKWYDLVGISYADVVRDIVYQDSDETFFNKKDVHYDHWAHQTIAWSVGFASLELLTNYCDDEYYTRKTHQSKSGNGNATVDANTSTMKDVIKNNKLFLPPPLTRELLLGNATAEFTAALDAAHQSYIDMNCTSTDSVDEDKNPCIISWIASPGGYNGRLINGFMRKYSTVNNGWKTEESLAEGWGNKVGLIAAEANATFTLTFDKVEKDVKTVTLFFLRSYGEKWENSRAKFTISRGKENKDGDGGESNGDGGVVIVSEEEISGVHNSSYSLTLPQTFDLSETVFKGETINIKVDLISGSTFKIMGMMICK